MATSHYDANTYGIGQLIRVAYPDKAGSRRLLDELLDAAKFLEIYEDHEHPSWLSYPESVRSKLSNIRTIGSRQARPVIYSAFRTFSSEEFEKFLWNLGVALVRFQLIGRGRTGILEKVLGRTCQKIWSQEITKASEAVNEWNEILPIDDLFLAGFLLHIEKRATRARYLLSEIERHASGPSDGLSHAKVIHLWPSDLDMDTDDQCYNIASYFLLEENLLAEFEHWMSNDVGKRHVSGVLNILSKSSFKLTASAGAFKNWDLAAMDKRSHELAIWAAKSWAVI